MEHNGTKPLKPIQYAEDQLLRAILKGEYPPGTPLPNERTLATMVGVTRPTLRETLHRLAREGWITIHHGKPTLVNDYWKQGGLGLLSTLAQYGEYLPPDFITHLLEFRVVIMPPIAGLAARHHADTLAGYLARAGDLPDDTMAYTEYDWELQSMLAGLADNVIYPMIFNDFSTLFKSMAQLYFGMKEGRESSARYYRNFAQALPDPLAVENVVRDVMMESARLWEETIKS
ncbi:MAG: GntR family transcriptional regulator [Desulfatibacillaceae bacterium]